MLIQVAQLGNLVRVTFDGQLPTPEDRLYFSGIAKLARRSEGTFERQGMPVPGVRSLVAYLQRRYEVDLVGDVAANLQQLAGREADLASRIQAARTIREAPPTPFTSPNLKRPLMSHQWGPAAHLSTLRAAANFSVPGSGKTSVVLTAFDQLRSEGAVEKLLVAAPLAAFRPWEEEFTECFGYTPATARIQGMPPHRHMIYAQPARYELFLVTYQMLANDLDDIEGLLSRHKFMVVLDESHYIKRIRGGVWAPAILQIAPLAHARAVLSGTPVPNGLTDLWTQLTFLYPDRHVLGTQEQYERRIERRGAVDEIRQSIQPYYWRVRRPELGLPVAQVHPAVVAMEPIQRQIYKALAAQILDEVVPAFEDRIRFREWRKARMVRLLQTASNPTLLSKGSDEFEVPPLGPNALGLGDIVDNYANFETPGKFKAARKIVETLVSGGHRVVVWSSFVHNLEMMSTELAHIPHVVVHGGIARDATIDEEQNREDLIESFKTDENVRVLIANPGACAESISLHRACQKSVFIDRTFNAAQFLQAMDRTNRVGLPHGAQVEYWVLKTEGSIDDVVDTRLEDKTRTMKRLLEGDIHVGDDAATDAWSDTEIDEERDFEAVLADLKRRYGTHGSA